MAKKPTTPKQNKATQASSSGLSVNFDKYAPHISIGVMILFLIIMFMIRLNFKEMSFERDEGTYSYMGKLLTEGKKPYSYFYEMKPPALYYMYGLIVAIFGTTVAGLHVGFFVVNFITCLFLFLWVRRMFNPAAGAIAAVAYSIISTAPHASGLTIQSEHLLCLFMVPGLWLLWEAFSQNKTWQWLTSGALLSWALLIKQNTLFFIAFAGLAIILHHFLVKKEKGIASLWRPVLLFGAGVIVPVLLVLGILVANGSFKDFIFFIYEYPKTQCLSSIEFSRGMGYMQNRYEAIKTNYEIIWYLGFAGLVLVWVFSKNMFLKISLTLLLIFSFLSVAPGLRFYGHYWIHFLPAVAVLFATAIYIITEKLKEKGVLKNPQFIAILVLCVVFFINLNTNKSYYFITDPETVVRGVYGTNPFVESRKVADYLNNKMQKNDQLVVFGSEPQIYMYTGKDAITRHFYTGNLVQLHPIVKEWSAEFKQDFMKAQPKYVVWVQHPYSWSLPKGASTEFIDWGWDTIKKGYHPIGYADIISHNQTEYVWDNEALNYRPKGNEYLMVLERNN